MALGGAEEQRQEGERNTEGRGRFSLHWGWGANPRLLVERDEM